MDQRPSGTKSPRFERPKTPPGITLPVPSKPGRCISCGAYYCCCKTMKNHQNFLEREFMSEAMSPAMVMMMNMMNEDAARVRSCRILEDDELTITLQPSSSSSSWKRPPPPIIPMKPLFRGPPPPQPPPPTNASGKKTFSQLSEKRKAKILENRMQNRSHPPPPPPPPPPPRTPSPAPMEDEEDGEMMTYSMDPRTVEFVKKMSSGGFGDLNFPSWGDIAVPTPRPPPKFSYGGSSANRANPAFRPPPPRTAPFGLDNGSDENFLGRSSAFKRPLTPPDPEGTGGTDTYSLNPGALEFAKKMASGGFGGLDFSSWNDIAGLPTTRTPPHLYDKPKPNPVTHANPLPPPQNLYFGCDENEEHFLKNNSSAVTVTKPSDPPNGIIVEESEGKITCRVNPETLEFINKMESEGFGALNFPSWDDAIVPTTPPHLVDGSIYGYDENTPPHSPLRALDLSWTGRGGTNDRSPEWSPTPSEEGKVEDNDMTPPPIPLGEIHLRPWYNKTSGCIIHSCLICSQGFVECEDLKKHQSEKHGANRAPVSSSKRLYCDHCDRAFVFDWQFEQHWDEHEYCKSCGEQLKQAVLNGFQRAAAVAMRGFMKGGVGVGLDSLCEWCKERERRIRALKRGATETVVWSEEEEDDSSGESFNEEGDEDEEDCEEEYEGEEEFSEEEEYEEEETDEDEEEMKERVRIEEMDMDEYLEEIEKKKGGERDIPENQLGDYVVQEEESEEEEEEEEEYGEEEEEVEEEEDDDGESMDDEETEEEEDE